MKFQDNKLMYILIALVAFYLGNQLCQMMFG